MKLYELHRGDLVRLAEEERRPENENRIYEFHHVDGAYSLCYTTTPERHIVHFAVWMPVERVEVKS